MGNFLHADDCTLTLSHPMYARICIEVDVSLILPSRVWIGTSKETGFWQQLEFEGNVAYCDGCGLLEHIEDDCRKKRRGVPQTARKGKKVEGDHGFVDKDNGLGSKFVAEEHGHHSLNTKGNLPHTTVEGDINTNQVVGTVTNKGTINQSGLMLRRNCKL